jgi:hypothetical protein
VHERVNGREGLTRRLDGNATVGTALAGAWADFDMHIGAEFRIVVSSEAGSRFDQNVTGFPQERSSGSTRRRVSRPASS